MMLPKQKATLSKSDRQENSVLVSLKELRRVENERVKTEADARVARAEAERRARAEAEQRARDEEMRRAREEEERRKRAESDREARDREDRLRLEEAERRARVEGEQRLRHTHGRRFGRSVWMATAVGAALFVAVGGAFAARASRQHQAEKQALEQEIAQARAAQQDFDAQIRALKEKARRDVAEAKTAKEQARILSDLQRQMRVLEANRTRPTRRPAAPTQTTGAPPKPPFGVPGKREISNDPLGALPGANSGAF
jgi:hypothetical protein